MHKLEYLWLDGCNPTQIRSKTKIVKSFDGEAPIWGFDGSSTQQADGSNSDCVLRPVRVYKNPLEAFDNGSIVLCEVWNVDDTPHETNTRRLLEETVDDTTTINKVSFYFLPIVLFCIFLLSMYMYNIPK